MIHIVRTNIFSLIFFLFFATGCDHGDDNIELVDTKWYRFDGDQIEYLYFDDSSMWGWRKEDTETCYYWYIDPYNLKGDRLSLYEGYWFTLPIRKNNDKLIFERGNNDFEYLTADFGLDTLITNQCEDGDDFRLTAHNKRLTRPLPRQLGKRE